MRNVYLILLSWLVYVISSPYCSAEEIITRYATITYENPELLSDFNENVRMGYKLSYQIKDEARQTLEKEVAAKIDVIVEQVEIVLDMFPKTIKFSIVLVEDEENIAAAHHKIYKHERDLVGFFSPKMNTVYLSVDDATLKVVAHEFGHVIVEKYFKISPPPRMHELLAQFAAANVAR